MVVMEIFESDVPLLFAPFFDVKSAEVNCLTKFEILVTPYKITKFVIM